ncbi:hypothetical protein NLU13_9582 [Sarocladium strictum]|uniref:Uncharacterized protein n=1 Tax=Sarocladium strictum TaxID=5046 RepID=A0AA39L3Z9_SARSR|nr:hypothetical protein NLU13_9582 [Sarocladium strictum]
MPSSSDNNPCDACALYVVAHSQLVRDKFGGFELAVDKNGKTISPPSDMAVYCEKALVALINAAGARAMLSKKARVAGAKIADAYLAWVAADYPLDDEAVCGSLTVTKRPNRRNAAGSATAGGAGCALSGAAVE